MARKMGMWLTYALAGQKPASVPSLSAFLKKVLRDFEVVHDGTVVKIEDDVEHRTAKNGVTVTSAAVAFLPI